MSDRESLFSALGIRRLLCAIRGHDNSFEAPAYPSSVGAYLECQRCGKKENV